MRTRVSEAVFRQRNLIDRYMLMNTEYLTFPVNMLRNMWLK